MNSAGEQRQRELYAGVFSNDHWTKESLINYFHQLIEGCSISECCFYPCTRDTRAGLSFLF